MGEAKRRGTFEERAAQAKENRKLKSRLCRRLKKLFTLQTGKGK